VNETSTYPGPGARAMLVAVLLLTMTVGIGMQFAIPVLGPLIMPDLGLSRAQLGAVTTLFFLVGAATSTSAGRWTDRVGGRRSLFATHLSAGLAFAIAAQAGSLALLLVAGAVAGLGAALANPATNRLILAGFPPGSRGAIVGLKQSGVQLGGLAAGVALPSLALLLGWQRALLSWTVLAVVTTGIILVTVPASLDPSGGRRAAGSSEGGGPTITVLCTFAALMGFGVSSINTYLPIYAVEVVGTSVTTAGFVVSVLAVLGIASRLGWGWGADRLARPIRVLPVLSIGALVGTGLLVLAASVGQWALWIGAGVLGATALGWNGVAMLVAMNAVPAARAGWASGRVILFFYVGLVVSPIPFGLLADRLGSYAVGWLFVALAFVAATVSTTVTSAARGERTRMTETQEVPEAGAGSDAGHARD
jgi:sugar phosphate permease